MKEICYIALSGGVDSAAAAVILKERGFDVRGITLRLKPGSLADGDIADAERVAAVLGIPLTVLDAREEFKAVTDYFCNEYLEGRTPNPCVFCNPSIKFGKMLEFALENGARYLATGHYSEIARDDDGLYVIRRNKTRKDQSYFLCRLNQQILSHTLFPLSDYSKDEVRLKAELAGLDVARKKDSQEVCFIPDNDYISFIEREKNPDAPGGNLVGTDGRVLGKHTGLYKYTIGQRKGLGAFGKPMYVLSVNKADNTVTIGENEELFRSTIKVGSLSFLKGTAPAGKFRAQVKIRCAAQPANALVTINNGTAAVEFETAQRAAAPGQTAAFYDGETLLGGSVIL